MKKQNDEKAKAPEDDKGTNGFVVFLIIVLVLGAVGGGVWYFYKNCMDSMGSDGMAYNTTYGQ